MLKEYLGDSVYVEVDIDQERLVLTTENGYGANITIYLEQSVVDALLKYLERVRKTEEDEP